MAVGNPGSGRSRQNLENRSTMTRMQVLLSDEGRSVMKSTPRCDHGRLGMGNGTSLPEGRWRELLEMAQSGQPWTNLLTSLAMFGHQKRSLSSERVALAPGWPVPSEVCDEWMRGVRCVLGTYWWLGGQPGGLGLAVDGGVIPRELRAGWSANGGVNSRKRRDGRAANGGDNSRERRDGWAANGGENSREQRDGRAANGGVNSREPRDGRAANGGVTPREPRDGRAANGGINSRERRA